MYQVAHFCTFPHGGAATAALRHHQSLLAAGRPSKFYYHRDQQQIEPDNNLVQLTFQKPQYGFFTGPFQKRAARRRQKRVYDLFNQHLAIRPESAETFSMAELPDATPFDWSKLKADIAHLHWISFFADYPSFFQSIPESTPLVWTLHDTNSFTGGCHYPSGCTRFRHGCGGCPQLIHRDRNDVSRASFLAKQNALSGRQIHVVAPCDWMLEMAQQSEIWPRETTFQKIEYGLDLEQEYPVVTDTCRLAARRELGLKHDQPVVAFGAMDVANRRKGIQQLLPALNQVHQSLDQRLECLVFGAGDLQQAALDLEGSHQLIEPTLHELGFVDSVQRKRQIYAAADLVVVPSLEDNQPQVGLEAMACGTPVVAFDATGLPEYVIPDVSGALAKVGDVDDLANTIASLLTDSEQCQRLGQGARKLVEQRFERNRQQRQWLSLYDSLVESRIDGSARRAA